MTVALLITIPILSILIVGLIISVAPESSNDSNL